jgi:putative membrane protein
LVKGVNEVKSLFSNEKKQAVIDAIKRNELRTTGEIYCVIARKSDDYRWVLMIWAVILALIVPLTLGVLGVDLAGYFTNLIYGWENFDNSAKYNLYIDLFIQSLIFVVFGFLMNNRDIVMALTPKFIKRQGVHKFALDQFMAHGIHQTDAKTGVLIYVSLGEHMIEIVADYGIYSKVEKAIWGDAIAKILVKTKQDDLGGGLVDGVDMVGDILAQHFPPNDNNPNELADNVIFI